MTGIRPSTTKDLRPSERRMIAAMRTLGFGRFEYSALSAARSFSIHGRRPCATSSSAPRILAPRRSRAADFELKPQVAELFEYVRAVEAGEIRTLEVKSGLPFSMEIEMAGGRRNG